MQAGGSNEWGKKKDAADAGTVDPPEAANTPS